MKYSALISHFDGAEAEADGVVVRCPAHADGRPSLKITLKEDGTALMVCRAGCSTSEILRAANVAPGDLFRVENDLALPTISAAPAEEIGIAEVAALRAFVTHTAGQLDADCPAYEYAHRRFGLTLDQCRELDIGYAPAGRYEFPHVSAAFRAHPRLTVPLVDSAGIARGLQGRDIGGQCPARWVSLRNADGRTWARYGYLSGGSGHATILVAEGPGDGLTAVGAGYDALVVRGAGLVRQEATVARIADEIRDRDVVLVGDPDSAGARFNAALTRALRAVGNTPRILSTGAGDLTDWRERDPGAFVGELHAAVHAAPPAPDPDAERTPDPEPSGVLSVAEDARAVFDTTDVGLSLRLREFLGGGIRHAPGLGYLVWTGRVWESGDTQVRQAIHQMGAALLSTGKDADRKLALRALTNRAIDAILAELPAIPGVGARADDFDGHPDLLTVANGTLNLRTGELRAHSPDDMITQCVDVPYDPGAEAAFWEQFLSDAFPNHPEMPAYLRRLNGYGITGHTSEQMFVFHHGSGQNGKSVYTDNLRLIFKGISRSTEFTTFEARAGVGQASPEVAGLRGYRMVMANETEKYNRLAEALVKQLTGGDPVTARFLHGNPFTFTPRFLLQVAGNYKPAIVSQDHGIWRRVKLIPWEARFDGARRRPRHEVDARIQEEAPGVLAWAVRGAREWYASGLGEPRTVQEATHEYRESEDRLAEFIDSCLVVEPGAEITPMELRRAYKAWMEESGFSSKEILAGRSLGVEMDSRGYPQERSRARRYHVGIRLKSDAEKAAAIAGATDIFGQGRVR